MIDLSVLDRVIQETKKAIERGKRDLFDIAEQTRNEYQRLKSELQKVQADIALTIKEVEETRRLFKKARLHLAEVNSNLQQYSEADREVAYETAEQLLVRLTSLEQKERFLQQQRNELELSLRRLTDIMAKAEHMAAHLTVVLNYLESDLQDLTYRIGELQQWQQLGLSIIRAQEEERRRIAREIHDGPAQLLANIVMRTEFILRLLEVQPQMVKPELQALQQLVRTSLADVRKIIFDLRPMVLDDLGLVPAIKKYISNFQEDTNIFCEFNVFGAERRVHSGIEIALFRILQEALTNVRKHAAARFVSIKLEFLNNKINMLIRDDGKGFDCEKVIRDPASSGYGLLGMRERVQLLKGTLTISSAPGQGTTIMVSVPLENA